MRFTAWPMRLLYHPADWVISEVVGGGLIKNNPGRGVGGMVSYERTVVVRKKGKIHPQ